MKSSRSNGKSNGRSPVDPDARWNAKVVKDPVRNCLLWKGTVNKFGRGKFYDGGVQWDIRVYAWFKHYGTLPSRPLKTACGIRNCVYWDHLTEKPLRQHRPQSTLSAADVREIRKRHGRGEAIKYIAKDFSDASEQTVRLAAIGKTYAWVTDDSETISTSNVPENVQPSTLQTHQPRKAGTQEPYRQPDYLTPVSVDEQRDLSDMSNRERMIYKSRLRALREEQQRLAEEQEE